MEFSNVSLEMENLPKLRDLSFASLEDEYRKIRLIIPTLFISFGLLLFVCAWFLLPKDIATPIMIGTGIVSSLFFFTLIYRYFADPLKGYALREQDLSYRSGLFVTKTTTQPMNRIQHVEVKQGPIDRKYDLAKLYAYSAGGQHYTFSIPGLTHEFAVKLRALILEHRSEQAHAE